MAQVFLTLDWRLPFFPKRGAPAKKKRRKFPRLGWITGFFWGRKPPPFIWPGPLCIFWLCPLRRAGLGCGGGGRGRGKTGFPGVPPPEIIGPAPTAISGFFTWVGWTKSAGSTTFASRSGGFFFPPGAKAPTRGFEPYARASPNTAPFFLRNGRSLGHRPNVWFSPRGRRQAPAPVFGCFNHWPEIRGPKELFRFLCGQKPLPDPSYTAQG